MMMARNLFALVASLTLATFLAACGARSDTNTRRFMRTPEGAASIRVERAIQRAELGVNSNEWQRVSVRYNPTHCGSPPWEAHLYGAWRRIVLQPTPNPASAHMKEASLRAVGESSESVAGWNYPVLQWRSLDEDTSDGSLGE